MASQSATSGLEGSAIPDVQALSPDSRGNRLRDRFPVRRVLAPTNGLQWLDERGREVTTATMPFLRWLSWQVLYGLVVLEAKGLPLVFREFFELGFSVLS